MSRVATKKGKHVRKYCPFFSFNYEYGIDKNAVSSVLIYKVLNEKLQKLNYAKKSLTTKHKSKVNYKPI